VLPALINLLPCIPYFAAGGLLALLLHRRDPRLQAFRLKPWQLAALCAAALVAAWCKGQHYLPLLWEPLNGMLLLAACLALVTESVLDDGLLRAPLSAAPLRALGLISYSVYLWQQLFLGPPDVYPHPWWWSRWPQNLCAALACGGAAYLLVERPSVWLRQRLRAHPAPRRAPAPRPLELLDS
jgi:peptidoglycan/LPS O-acetylase OafA/YrhL